MLADEYATVKDAVAKQMPLEEAQAKLTFPQYKDWRNYERLKNEISSEIASDAKGVQQDLLFEVMHQVNWAEIAEDLLAR